MHFTAAIHSHRPYRVTSFKLILLYGANAVIESVNEAM